MKSFEIDLINPFDDEKITDSKMDAFVTSLLTKFTNNNVAGMFDAVIAAIEVPHNPYHIIILKLASDATGTKGDTEFRVDVFTDFKTFTSENYGAVKKMYKANNPVLIKFYPFGMKDYYAINKTTGLTLMTRYALAISTYHADWDTIDPDFVSVGEAFPARYEAALEFQDEGKSGTGADKGVRNVNRPLLNVALLDAYNYTKYIYSNNATQIKAIWIDMQALIPTDSHDERETNKGPIAKMTLVNAASGNYDATYYILLRNVGTTKLRGGLQATATEAVGALGKNINPGKSKSYQLITLGAPGAQFFNIFNTDLNNAGEWEIEIYTKE